MKEKGRLRGFKGMGVDPPKVTECDEDVGSEKA